MAASNASGAAWGVGYDSTSALSGTTGYGSSTTAVFGTAEYQAAAIGFHYFQALEYSQGGTSTYYGDAGLAFFQSGLHFSGRF
jgi:hypothetical protein